MAKVRCLRHGLALVAALVSLLTAIGVAAVPSAADPAGSSQPAVAGSIAQPSQQDKVTTADYFGIGNPYNFWSSDLSGARAAFRQMRADGFNTVGLVVPWDDFEPSLNPPSYNTNDFTELQNLVELANSLHLGVALRLSYATDVDPNDQLAWGQRFAEAYGDAVIYNDWLNYISTVEQYMAPYPNVRVAYLSWEDFWGPVGDASLLTDVHQRITLAQTIGFTSWLQQHMSLSQTGEAYGTSFTSWSEVPTPSRSQRAFKLLFRFYDDMVVNRFFLPALQRFLGLTLEARDDVDPIFNGNQVVGGFPHNSTWSLPGTNLTGVDYAPYMRDPSPSRHETAQEAYDGLKATLAFISHRTGKRRLFINQFLFMDNARISAALPHIAPSQIRPFLHLALGPIDQYTDGFGVWAYRDYNVSPLYNPSFALGTAGWTTSGQVTTVSQPGTPAYVSLLPGQSVAQVAALDGVGPVTQFPFVVSVAARATHRSSRLKIRIGSAPLQVLSLSTSWQTYTVRLPGTEFGSGLLKLSTPGSAQVSDVQVYNFTENGDVYGVNGAPKIALPALQWLNKRVDGR